MKPAEKHSSPRREARKDHTLFYPVPSGERCLAPASPPRPQPASPCTDDFCCRLLGYPVHQPRQHIIAGLELILADIFIGLVCDRDRARAADNRLNAEVALVKPALGAEGDLPRRIAARQ